jgi:hypothetical protein
VTLKGRFLAGGKVVQNLYIVYFLMSFMSSPSLYVIAQFLDPVTCTFIRYVTIMFVMGKSQM